MSHPSRIDTMVDCPICERCPECGGMHLVTAERRAELLRELNRSPSLPCDRKSDPDD